MLYIDNYPEEKKYYEDTKIREWQHGGYTYLLTAGQRYNFDLLYSQVTSQYLMNKCYGNTDEFDYFIKTLKFSEINKIISVSGPDFYQLWMKWYRLNSPTKIKLPEFSIIYDAEILDIVNPIYIFWEER